MNKYSAYCNRMEFTGGFDLVDEVPSNWLYKIGEEQQSSEYIKIVNEIKKEQNSYTFNQFDIISDRFRCERFVNNQVIVKVDNWQSCTGDYEVEFKKFIDFVEVVDRVYRKFLDIKKYSL